MSAALSDQCLALVFQYAIPYTRKFLCCCTHWRHLAESELTAVVPEPGLWRHLTPSRAHMPGLHQALITGELPLIAAALRECGLERHMSEVRALDLAQFEEPMRALAACQSCGLEPDSLTALDLSCYGADPDLLGGSLDLASHSWPALVSLRLDGRALSASDAEALGRLSSGLESLSVRRCSGPLSDLARMLAPLERLVTIDITGAALEPTRFLSEIQIAPQIKKLRCSKLTLNPRASVLKRFTALEELVADVIASGRHSSQIPLDPACVRDMSQLTKLQLCLEKPIEQLEIHRNPALRAVCINGAGLGRLYIQDCQSLHQLQFTQIHRALQTLVLERISCDGSSIETVLARTPLLRSIRLCDLPCIEALDLALASGRALRHVELSSLSHIRRISARALRDLKSLFIEGCPSLSTLDLQCSATSRAFNLHIDHASSVPLNVLNLSQSNNKSSWCNCSLCYIGGVSSDQIAALLQVASLESLDLSYLSIDPLSCIVPADNSRLQTLNLMNCSTLREPEHVLEILALLPALTSIDLRRCPLSRVAATRQSVTEGLAKIPQLQFRI